MSALRQAAEQALEALENLCRSLSPESVLATSLNHRITALRAALAEEALQRLTDVSQEIEAARGIKGDA